MNRNLDIMLSEMDAIMEEEYNNWRNAEIDEHNAMFEYPLQRTRGHYSREDGECYAM